MISAEVSLYPNKTPRASDIIQDSLDTLLDLKLETRVGAISTELIGSEEDVWKGLKAMFDRAKKESEVNMIVTLSISGT